MKLAVILGSGINAEQVKESSPHTTLYGASSEDIKKTATWFNDKISSILEAL